MNINVNMAMLLPLFFAVIPAILAIYLAHKQKRSKLIAGLATFFLGFFTWVGGWILLGIMNFLEAKKEVSE